MSGGQGRGKGIGRVIIRERTGKGRKEHGEWKRRKRVVNRIRKR